MQMSRVVVLLCLILSSFFTAHGQTLRLSRRQKKFIKERENLVKDLALYASNLHDQRVRFVRNCNCSRHGCSNDFLDLPCVHRYGTQPFCNTKGWRIDFKDTIFRTAPGANPKNLSDSLKENICVYKHIYDHVIQYNESDFSWMYVATPDGHFRRYPASARERGEHDGDALLGGCRQFDPRLRPWFIAASTGPKDIVLVIDRSDSMGEFDLTGNETKWELTLEAVEKILGTLSISDFVNVVIFSDKAKSLNKKGLLRADSGHLKKLRRKIEKVVLGGNTNFTAAFETAFDQLTNYCKEEPKTCSNCHKVILFLTDGRDTSEYFGRSIKPSKFAEIVDGFQDRLVNKTGKRASIFTYSMSKEADDAIPRQLACANDGAWAFIGSGVDPLDALNSYYLYLAAGRKNVNPSWVEPFEDAAGLGTITTVAMPFFARGTSRVPDVFLGVAGLDVSVGDLAIDSATTEQVLKAIVDRSGRCTPSETSPCELQAYRNSRDPRGVCTDRFPIKERRHPLTKKMDVQCYGLSDKFYKRFPNEVEWKEAKKLCKKDRGTLATIEDELHLAFVANFASLDGSWVGAVRKNDKYFWLEKDVGDIPESSSFWGVGEPVYRHGEEDCVAIDSRGIVSNLMARRCSERRSFICQYASKKRCKAGVMKIPEKGYFTVPPLAACQIVVEVLDQTKPLAAVKKLKSKKVMCPLGRRKKTTKQVICCAKETAKNASGI